MAHQPSRPARGISAAYFTASRPLQLCNRLGVAGSLPPLAPARLPQCPQAINRYRSWSTFGVRAAASVTAGEPGRLQLRAVLRPGENVCEILVEENETRVEVRILVCGGIEGGNDAMDCPFHVYLSAALGGREVIDMARNGARVEHFTPNW